MCVCVCVCVCVYNLSVNTLFTDCFYLLLPIIITVKYLPTLVSHDTPGKVIYIKALEVNYCLMKLYRLGQH